MFIPITYTTLTIASTSIALTNVTALCPATQLLLLLLHLTDAGFTSLILLSLAADTGRTVRNHLYSSCSSYCL